MSVSKYNAEGYADPTAYEAMTAVLAEDTKGKQEQRKYRPKVFISSPFAGDVENNIINARRYCAFAVESGYIPFAPHLLFPQFLDDGDTEQRKLGLFMGKVFLDGCKEVWVFGGVISSGMEDEISRANMRGIPVRYFNDRCEEVQRWAFQEN